MENNKKIAIIGFGVVGKAVEEYFNSKAEICIYDPQHNKISKEDVNNCDIAFICVPTPRKKDDSCDTSIVEEVISWLQTPLIVIKSTIKPGTTDMLITKYNKNIVFSPEYISESKYFNPIMRKIAEQPFIIFGGTEENCKKAQDILTEFFGPLVDIFTCTAKEAELVKYFENTFFTVKVSFVNEMREICEKAGVNYYKVRDGWLLDPRINKNHTMAFKDTRGYSGKCFPKDRAALVKWCKDELSYVPPVIDSAKNWDFSQNI
jgi:nucleotide sugar dehydrogenase